MKKMIRQIAIVMSAVAFFACSKDNGGQGVPVAGDQCEVTLNISSAPSVRGITDDTRDGTAYENAVNVLEFYVFDSDGAPDTEVGRVSESEAGKGYKRITTDSNEKTHKLLMSGGDDKDIVVVINMDLGELETNTYAGLKAELAKWTYTAAGGAYNARAEAERPLGFEMTGEKGFSIDAGSVNHSVTVNVARLSSRINAPQFAGPGAAGFVDLSSDELEEIWGDDAADAVNLTYKPVGYAVINGRAKSDAFFIGNVDTKTGIGNDRLTVERSVAGQTEKVNVPKWDIWTAAAAGREKAALRSAFGGAEGAKFYSSVYSGKGVSDDWFLSGTEADNEHRVYVFENKPGNITVGNITGYDPAQTYALIIKGSIIVDGDDANANGLNRTRYWRVDLTRDDDYHVFRNTSYDISVTRITTPGYDNPKDAEEDNEVIPGKEQTALDVTIRPSEWRINTFNTEM